MTISSLSREAAPASLKADCQPQQEETSCVRRAAGESGDPFRASTESPGSAASASSSQGIAGAHRRSSASAAQSGRPQARPRFPHNSSGPAVVVTEKRCPRTDVFEEGLPGRQRFFRGHSDDIVCIAMHPKGLLFATGEVGKAPAVCVWGSAACDERRRIVHEEGSRSVFAAGFSGGRGRYLATVTTDNRHTVRVYEWAASRRISEGPGSNGAPPQVHGVEWDWRGSPDGEERFATWGVKHLKVWELQDDGRQRRYVGKPCSFGKAAPQDVLCATFLPPGVEAALAQIGVAVGCEGKAARRARARPEGLIATGHPSGEVYLWRSRAVIRVLRVCEARIAQPTQSDSGGGRDRGVRCIHLWEQGAQRFAPGNAAGGSDRVRTPEEFRHNDGAWVLLAGGGDGAIHMWDLGFAESEPWDAGSLPPAPSCLRPLYLPAGAGGSKQVAHSLQLQDDGEVLYACTGESDVWALDVRLRKVLADPDARTSGSFGQVWYQATANRDASRDARASPYPPPRRLVAGPSLGVGAVAFHPKVPEVFAIGCDDGEVMVYHAGQRHPVGNRVAAPARVCSLAFSNPEGHHIACGLATGEIQVFDRRRSRVASMADADRPINDVKYSPSGKVMAAADSCQAISLYRVSGKRYDLYASCTGHSSSVASVDFSSDGRVLQSVSTSYELLHWSVAEGCQLVESQADQSWSTWTAKIGFPVMGIWDGQADGSDVNSVCACEARSFVVTADDRGMVRIFNFPCVASVPGARDHKGHSSHVQMLRISSDGLRVVSVGGADCAILQWRVRQHSSSEGAEGTQDWRSALESAVQQQLQKRRTLGGMAERGSRGAAASVSIAEQMLSRRMAGANESVRRRVAEMQRALDAELAKIGRPDRPPGSRNRQEVVPPNGKAWGPLDGAGLRMGWVESRGGGAASPPREELGPPPG